MKMIVRVFAVVVCCVVVARADFRTGNLDVTNNLTVSNNVSIAGNVTITNGTLTVTRLASPDPHGDGIAIDGIVRLTNDYLSAKGITSSDGLTVLSGVSTFHGNIDAKSVAQFRGDSAFYGEVSIYSNLHLRNIVGGGNLYVEGTATVAGASVLTTATGVSTNDTRYLAALTNETDTLATVLSRGNNAAGQSATNFADIQGTGNMVLGSGFTLDSIGVNAYGAGIFGTDFYNGDTTIGSGSCGSFIRGTLGFLPVTIAPGVYGASIEGYMVVITTMGRVASGAAIHGVVGSSQIATNGGAGAVQLLDGPNAPSPATATTSADGGASLMLGFATITNKESIVAGTGQESHGDGSITAGGGFYGPSATLTATLTASNIIQTAGGWDDLLFPANTIYAFGLTDIEFKGPSNSITFKATCNTNFASDNVWIVGQLPHSIKTNSAHISPHIHFLQTASTQTNMFYLRGKRYKIGEAIPTNWTDYGVCSNDFAYTSGTIHQVAECDNIAGPFGISEIFDFKIWSRGGVAVDMKQFDIHFQRDSLGSDSEYSKSF